MRFRRSRQRNNHEQRRPRVFLRIALPLLRVALTTAIFLFERDYFFAAIVRAVLGIIALGFLLS